MYLRLTNKGFEILNQDKKVIETHRSYEELVENNRVFDEDSCVESAVEYMFENNHKLAIFGVNRQFMFTKIWG
jgi:hypothetical protein